MLAITLDPHQHIETYQANQSDDWRFQVKVVNDGLFAEVRVCFLPVEGKKRTRIKDDREPFFNKGNIRS